MIEVAYSERTGKELWAEEYILSRLSAPGEEIVRAGKRYIVLRSEVYAGKVLTTVDELEISVFCPFCGEDDFDLIGLKIHFQNGHCAKYNAVFTV